MGIPGGEEREKGTEEKFDTIVTENVVEPNFVCPMHSEAKQTEMSEFGAEKGLLQGPSKEHEQLMLKKKPKLSDGFEGRIFKGKFWGRAAGCVAFF